MNAVYCEKCGFGNEYSFNKPKFCGECAHEIGAMFQSNSLSSEKLTIDSKEEESPCDEEYISLNDLSSLLKGAKVDVSFADQDKLVSVNIE